MNVCLFASATVSTKPPIIGYRYKQTSVALSNNGYATYDGQGYIATAVTTNYFRGDSVSVNFTADHSDIFAIAFTRNRSTSGNASCNIRQNGQNVTSFFIDPTANQVYFNGTFLYN